MDGVWTITGLWNDLLPEDNPIEPRNYIRASEIGKPFLDRYLAMRGVRPTNTFPARVRRIFDCGNIFEHTVERLFRLAGIMIDAQETLLIKKPDLLEVSGHYDFKVGGTINVSSAKENLNNDDIPLWLKRRAEKLIDTLASRYPNGLKTVIAEVKSVNSRSFWAYKNQDRETGFFKGYPHHKLQLFTYLLGSGLDEGKLFYVSKDDLTLMETSVFRKDKNLEDKWMEDVTTMTKYIKHNKEPEKEKDIVFNYETNRWEVNWALGRSNYLTMLTGFETADLWQASLQEELKNLNKGNCAICNKMYQLTTLDKYDGLCGKCYKKQPVNKAKLDYDLDIKLGGVSMAWQ